MTPDLLLLLIAGAGVLGIGALSGGDDEGDPADGPILFHGGSGDDELRADADELADADQGPVTVILDGGAGDDTIYGEIGNTSLNRPDIDRFEIRGGDGDDLIWSRDEGRETLTDGGAGNDSIYGWQQSWSPETLQGGEGDDLLQSGGDTMEGGAGDDTLVAAPIGPDYETPPLDPANPEDTVYDPDMEGAPTVLTGGEGADDFALSAGYWQHVNDARAPGDAPSQQMNDVLVTDFDPAEDQLVLPDRVGLFHSRDFLDSLPDSILNVTAAFDGITAEPTADGTGTVLTVHYAAVQEQELDPLMVRITLAGVTDFDTASIAFSSATPIDYDAVIARAGLG